MSGFASYEIARSGLFASERALYVTGHNISNVNTQGFSRQQAILASAAPDYSGKFPIGLGATIEEIRQIRHTFLDNVYRAENELLGYHETRLKTFNDIESILGEPMSEGIQSVLNQFWDSWHELSKSPESLTVRALVRQRANAFAEQVNHIGEQLNKLQEDLDSEIKVRINEINTLAGNIADLNLKILKYENGGDTANDFRDERAMYLDRLSKLVNVNVYERQDGMVDVDIAGHFLVSRGNTSKIYAGENTLGSVYVAPKWEINDQLVDVKSGILKGLLQARGESVVGATDSVSNGSPNDKADITIAVNLSNAADLTSLQTNIAQFLDRLDNKGLNYRLNLVTYGGTTGADVPQQFADRASFEAAISALPALGASANADFTSLVTQLETNVTYRNEANRYLAVFTDQAADAGAVLDAQISDLSQLGMTTFVASPDNDAVTPGFQSDPGWQDMANTTGGSVYDLSAVDYDILGLDINRNVNQKISSIPASYDIISDIKRRLNGLINIIAREINSLHKSGVDKYGNPGEDFFVKEISTSPLRMGNIKVNPNFSVLDRIAAAVTPAPGDNVLAQQIVSLRHANLFGSVTQSSNSDDYYRSIILKLGNDGNEEMRIVEGQSKLLQSAENQRTAISGVSMDEEMSNMIKFQYSYNAASKVISLMDECFENIINRLGTQGR